MAVDFITWTPISYYFILAAFLICALSIATVLMRTPISFYDFLIAVLGSLVLSFIGYFMPNLQIASLAIFLAGAFAVALLTTRGEALTSLVATVLMLGTLYLSSIYLVQPYTPLSRTEVGGPTLMLHQLKNYSFALGENSVLKQGSKQVAQEVETEK